VWVSLRAPYTRSARSRPGQASRRPISKKVANPVFLRFSEVPAGTQGVTLRMSRWARRADGWG
jgi:hypothetical protein